MAASIDLGTAWMNVVPSFKGVGKSVGQAMGEADSQVEAAASGWGESIKSSLSSAFSSTALLAGAGAAVVAGVGGALYQIGETFDSVTDTIRVGTGASGEALDGLVTVAQEIGARVPASFDKIGTTVADLNTRLGLSGETLNTVASQYLEAGRILGEDIDIQATTAAFSAFRIEGDQVEGAMDDLFRASQATGVGMNELASSASTSAPAMQALGFSFQETISLIGSLDKAGLDSNQTMAAMSKGLVSLAKKGEEPQAAFKRVTSEIKTLVEAGNTAKAIDLASGIFGTRAATQFVGAVQSGTLALDDLVGATGATSDTILGVADETKDFAEQWQIVKNNAALALEPLASTVFQTLGDTLTDLINPMQQASQWLRDNPQLTKALITTVGVLSTTLGVAAAAQWAVNTAMAANPVVWVVAALAALTAGLVYAYQNSEQFRAVVQQAWTSIKDAAARVVDWFQTTALPALTAAWEWIKATASSLVVWFQTTALPVLLTVWEGIRAGAEVVAAWFTTTLLPALQGVWQAVSEYALAAWEWIKWAWDTIGYPVASFILTVFQGVAANWGPIWEGIKTTVSGAWQVISTVVSTALEVIKNLFNLGTAILRGDWAAAWEAIKGIVSAVWEGIKGVVSGALDILKGVVSTALSVVKGVWSGAWTAISSAVSSAWAGIKSVVSRGVTTMMSTIQTIPSRVRSAFAGAGTWLLDAGRTIISGLVDGIKSKFAAVKSSLTGLTSLLPSWKGPAERDAVLLRPAGELIISGLRESMESEYASVRASLISFTKSLQPDVKTSYGFAASGAVVPASQSLDGTSLVLRVGDREMTAWVEERVDGRIILADQVRA